MPRVSVLVPSYQRPESLRRCLTALDAQTRRPDEAVIGVRRNDAASVAVAETASELGFPVRVVLVDRSGVIAAMQAALASCTGDIIALTDDDARPFPDWIARLLAQFDASPGVGGVGGRDWQPHERGEMHRVGIVQWFGRVIGNHHLGVGPARDVDVLKGANCAYRASLLRAVGFDDRLLGEGAQMHWELGVCLPLRRVGWRLVYDPAIAVDHDVAPRYNDDQLHRGVFSEAPLRNAVHNETLALVEGRGVWWRVVFLIWAFSVGTREGPGLVQAARRLLRGDGTTLARWRASVAGRLAGLATAHRLPRQFNIPAPPRP